MDNTAITRLKRELSMIRANWTLQGDYQELEAKYQQLAAENIHLKLQLSLNFGASEQASIDEAVNSDPSGL